MRKNLLIVLGLLIGIGVAAQQRNYTSIRKAVPRTINQGIEKAGQSSDWAIGWDNADVIYNRSGDLLKTTISTSLNVFGIFSTDQRVISARPEADLIAFGNRAGGPSGATGNDLRVSFSTDLGTTWNSVLVSSLTGRNIRYPSTIIYNPEGNTDPDNMFAIFAAPATDGTNWVSNYFGSIGLDGQNLDINYRDNVPLPYINHLNIDLCVTNAGNVHVASQYLSGTSASYVYEGFDIQNGLFNPETSVVDWEPEVVRIETEAGDENRIDANRLVFSPDGSVGYFLGTGIDLDPVYNPYGIEWPIVFKTTDQGLTWEKTEPFDFSQINVLYEYLYPTVANLDLVVPRWYNKWVGSTGNGATVDMNGNLHIAGILLGTTSIHPDSLTYFYNEEPRLMFDVFMNGDGTWGAQFIDTIRTESVDETAEFSMGWDQRIRMNRTADGSKVFATWADTDPVLWGASVTTNLYPDLYIWGYDMISHLYTAPVNVTALGDYWGDNFFLHSSDMVLEQGSDYMIPISTSFGPDEDGPITHQYFSGPGFNEAEFINPGAGNINPPARVLSISQNYPNPFSSISALDINLAAASRVSLEVYNLVGQKVLGLPARNLGTGTHTLYMNAASLKPGIYMYTVIADGERISRKMVVN